MTPAIVLFDVGGVLVELSGVGEFGQLLGGADERQVWATWLASEAVRRFERGQCEPEAFALEIIAELELPVAPATFLERFLTWPGRPYPGALQLVAEVRAQVPVGCLSNSNDLHWSGPMRRFGLHDAFDHVFVSHQMGTLKPDREAFAYVLSRLSVSPEQVLFMDDNQVNVDGARASGMDAELTRGPAEARDLLRERGLLV